MNITRRYRLVAIVGEYQVQGQPKKRYVRAGTLLETDTGPVVFLDSTFNPAGARSKDGSVLLSAYPEDEDSSGPGGRNEPF